MGKKLFIRVLLFGLILSACSKEEDKPSGGLKYPMTFLANRIEKVADFKCYVGSPSGGKEISGTLLGPRELWEGRIDTNPIWITLMNETEMEQNNGISSRKYSYKLSSDSLFILNVTNGWDFVAKLSSGKMIYHLGFEFYTKSTDGVWQSGISQSVRLMEDKYMFGSIFDSPANMMNIKDTLAWCNIYYEYLLKNE